MTAPCYSVFFVPFFTDLFNEIYKYILINMEINLCIMQKKKRKIKACPATELETKYIYSLYPMQLFIVVIVVSLRFLLQQLGPLGKHLVSSIV